MGDYKKSAIDRNDERHTKIPDEEVNNKPSKSKNKKKWCKGKIGVEHDAVCLKYRDVHKTPEESPASGIANTNIWRILCCKKCGKNIDYYYPMTWSNHFLKEEKKPDWVLD